MSTSPGSSMSNTRPDLGQAMDTIDLIAAKEGFIGLKIAPVLEVPRKAGALGKIPIGSLLLPKNAQRNPDGSYPRISGQGDKVSYSTEEFGLEEPVDDNTAADTMDMWDSEYLAALRTMYGVLEAHEQRVIAGALGISYTTAAGAVWSTTTTDIVSQINGYKETVRLRCGRMPNALVVDSKAIGYMMMNDSIQECFPGAADRTPKAIKLIGLAAALGLDEIIESSSVKNTSLTETASLSANWTNTKALLFVRETSPDTRKPQFMRTVHWGADGSQIGSVFEQYRDERVRADIIRHRMETDEIVMYEECATIITSIL